MKFVKNIISGVLVMTSGYWSANFALAQDVTTAIPATAVAQAAVDKKAELRAMVSGLSSFQAGFKQQVFDADGKAIMQGKGQVYLSQPSLIRWHALSPDENLLVSDGQTLWIHNIDLAQVTAMSAKKAIDSTPFSLLTSKDDGLWAQYQVIQAPANDQAFVVSPLVQSGQVKQLTIFFQGSHFNRLVIADVSGQTSEFSFNDIKTNQKLQQTLFTFALPEGVDLDDQR